MKRTFNRVGKFFKAHKFIGFLIIVVVLALGYFIISKALAKPIAPQYVFGTVKRGTISKTVTGSGQVAAENQLDVASEVSGKITSIPAKVGQHVNAGDLIATIDARDALLDLENAKISLAKLNEPAKVGDVTNAENNLNKSYSDGFASISNVFLHFPSIISGLKDTLYTRTGYLSDQQASSLSETGRNYRFRAATSYEYTNTDYNNLLQEYRILDKTNTVAMESMLLKTYALEQKLAETLKDAQSAFIFISTSQPDYNPSGATAAGASITSWANTVTSDLSSILSARNSIDSSKEALRKINEGTDALDIKSQQLSVTQKQRTYEKYFIRSPFEGVIGRIPVDVFDQASGGTVIATLSSDKKITTIPLNEVDAVQVKNGQRVKLTFDAIGDLNIDGIVTQVDLVGTASQGVVTYNIKIAFDGTDPRIRSGMSVDASIITEEKTGIVVVPAGAIKTFGAGQNMKNYVEVQKADGTIERSIITTGSTDDTNTEILSGLNEGDKIVVRTIAGTGARSTTPTIFSGLGGSQRNVVQNANRAGGTGAVRAPAAR
jgi:multidrug efflux pump subunit AcrA (membrane-fusion protein)